MNRGRYIGFGKESKAGPEISNPKLIPAIPMGSGRCQDCGIIRPFDQLEWIGCDEFGNDDYRCKDGHTSTPTSGENEPGS